MLPVILPEDDVRALMAAGSGDVDLEAGEEEQEGEPDEREHLDRLVDLDPAEHRRADDDPEDDLEHHRRQPQLRHEAERERRREPGDDDDQQVLERDLRHARCVRR